MLEVRTRSGWVRLGPASAPGVAETEVITIRGARPGQELRVGLTVVRADGRGTVDVRPAADEHLQGHVGLIPVYADERMVGEVELVPAKLSEAAYGILRADLQRVWTDLIFDPAGTATVRARPPTAEELWRRLSTPVARILRQPHEQLAVGTAVRRLERVRRTGELRPAVVRAWQRGRPALTRTLARTSATPENQLVGRTLRLLRSHARRDPDAGDVARRVDTLLTNPLFATPAVQLRRITWGMRRDPRYQQVLAVYETLNRPELTPTEGPGELRIGVRALSRLYEYWVFLQVLLAAQGRYGPPLGDGFEALVVRAQGSRARLELPAGTTVTFPGPVHVAFEPAFTSRADGWMGVEYVPHPDPDRQQFRATPDVAVLRDEPPSLVLIDAKYVGRHWVEREAARVHEKYARMRRDGAPVVTDVVVAHPHRGLSSTWCGYRHIPLVPAEETSATITQFLPTPPASTAARWPATPAPALMPEQGPPPTADPPGATAGVDPAEGSPTVSPPPRVGYDALGRARAAIDDYVRRAGGAVLLTELGDLVSQHVPEVAQAPRWFGAGNLTGFLEQHLPHLERLAGAGGGRLTLPGGQWAGAPSKPSAPRPDSATAPARTADTSVAQAVALLDELLEDEHGPMGLPALGAVLLKRFPALAVPPRWAGCGSFTMFLEQHAPHLRRLPGPGGGSVELRRDVTQGSDRPRLG